MPTPPSSEPKRPAKARGTGGGPGWAVVSDFDGTITLRDVGDSILLRFGTATKREIEDSYAFGVDMGEWMRKSFKNLRASQKDIQDHVRSTTRLRSGFKRFIRFCSDNSVPFEIVSGGVDLYANPVFSKHRLKARSFFGKARVTGAGVKISYPFLKGRTLDGFKAQRVRSLRRSGYKVIFCGDGTTDLEAALAADKVFAAKKLLAHCRASGLRPARLKNFHQVLAFIRARTAGEIPAARPALC